MRRSPLLLLALAAAPACAGIHEVESPPRVAAGAAFELRLGLVALEAGSGAPAICVERPDGFGLLGLELGGRPSGAGPVLTASVAEDAALAAGLTARPRHQWTCWRAGPISFVDAAVGEARLRLTAPASAGAWTLRATVGPEPGGGGAPRLVTRRITVDALPDPADDWRSRAAPGPFELRRVRATPGGFVAVGSEGAIRSGLGLGRVVAEDLAGVALHDVAVGLGRRIAVGERGLVLTSSLTGTWSVLAPAGSGPDLLGVAAGAGQFVAVGEGGAIRQIGLGPVRTATVVGAGRLTALAWGAGRFVAVGAAGAVFTSTSGARWSRAADGLTTRDLADVAFGPGGFVAVGAGGAVMRSPDGLAWSLSLISASALRAVAFEDQAAWVVGDAGLVARLDGAGWILAPVATDRALLGLASTPLGLIAVGERGVVIGRGTPALTVGAPSIELGRVPEGATATAALALQSSGTARLSLDAASLVGDAGWRVDADCGPATLEPGEACALALRFTAGGGTGTATLSLASNDPLRPRLLVPLRAEIAHPTPRLVLDAERLDLGVVQLGRVGTATLGLTNGGGVPMQLGLTAPSAPFSVRRETCTASSLAPGAGCVVVVDFEPTADGAASGTLGVQSDDPARPSARVSLAGVGRRLPQPRLVFADSVGAADDRLVDFGAVEPGRVADAAVRIGNAGDAPLRELRVRLETSASEFTLDASACPEVLLASIQCVVVLDFRPTVPGARTARLVIESADPARPRIELELRGSGAEPEPPVVALEVTDDIPPVSDRRLVFGSVVVGEAATGRVTVRNPGPLDLVFGRTTQALDGPGFELVSDDCATSTLTAGLSCQLVVRFVPVEVGDAADRLTLRTNAVSDPRLRIVLAGSGRAAPTPDDANQPPDTPVLLSPENGAEGVGTSPRLEWTAVSDPDRDPVRYRVRVCEDPTLESCAPVEVGAVLGLRLGSDPDVGDGVGHPPPGALALLLAFALVLLRVSVARRRRIGWLGLGLAAGLSAGLAACAEPDGPSLRVEDLKPDTSYFWQVEAEDGRGGRRGSVVWRFRT